MRGACANQNRHVIAALKGNPPDILTLLLHDQIAAGDVGFVRLTDLLCRGQACRVYAGTTAFACDYGHLTREGARLLVGRLASRYPLVWCCVMP